MREAPQHWLETFSGGPYRLMMLAAVAVTGALWWRFTRKTPALFSVWIGALVGAFFGAKVAYLLAEGVSDWPQPDRWLRLATGKSVLGGLLGGWIGVEVAKKLVGHHASTGDRFALLAPAGIGLGRIGCCLHGCCRGHVLEHPTWCAVKDAEGLPRWPAAQVELVFQLAALGFFAVAIHRRWWRDRLFFLYLTAYGLFRAVHETWRETPRLPGGLSGYQWLALGMAAAGLWCFVRRGRGVT